MCDCISMTDEALKKDGLRLEIGITLGENMKAFIPISTAPIDSAPVGRGHRKKSCPTIIPSYCPFCGEEMKP